MAGPATVELLLFTRDPVKGAEAASPTALRRTAVPGKKVYWLIRNNALSSPAEIRTRETDEKPNRLSPIPPEVGETAPARSFIGSSGTRLAQLSGVPQPIAVRLEGRRGTRCGKSSFQVRLSPNIFCLHFVPFPCALRYARADAGTFASRGRSEGV